MTDLERLTIEYKKKKVVIDIWCYLFVIIDILISISNLVVIINKLPKNISKDISNLFLEYGGFTVIVIGITSLISIWIINIVLKSICDHIIINADKAITLEAGLININKSLQKETNETNRSVL